MWKKIVKYKLGKNGIAPTKAHNTDLGIDLYSPQEVVLQKDDNVALVPMQISFQLPDGYGALIKDRSSLASNGVHILGGVIDPDYVGEIVLCMKNFNNTPYVIRNGDKIAQMVLIPYEDIELSGVGKLKETKRNDKGFGSSGR